jgi:HEAT repeat protein
MSAGELSRTLEHPNAWWRETAQRLLVERRDRSAIPLLRTVAQDGRSEVARIHALWTLDGLGGLDTADIAAALQDRHPAVRETAVRLAETRVAESQDFLRRLLRLADDPDDRVRFHLALALGETEDSRALDALATLARRDGAQPWMRAAILSSVRERTNEFLRAFVASPPSSEAVRAAVMQDLGQLFGAGQTPERCLDLIFQIAEPNAEFGWQPAAVSGIAQGLRVRGLGKENRSALMTLIAGDSPEARSAKGRMPLVLSRSSAMALDDSAPVNQRLAAIALLGHTDYATAGITLQSLLAPKQSSEVQIAAVRALSQLPERAAAASLVEPRRWQAFTPQVREAVLSVLIADEQHTPVLLDALEHGSITGTDLGSSRRSRLTGHRNAGIQTRARALFAAMDSGDRMQVYERLRATVLNRAADPASGKKVFASQCAACHAVEGTGGQLGPDLTGIRNQPADAITMEQAQPASSVRVLLNWTRPSR